MINADEVFNPKDFESIRLSVYFKNLTTRTEVSDPKKITFIEVGDKWIVLEMPAKSCAAKHNAMVDIKHARVSPKKPEVPILSVTGKVYAMDDLGDGRSRVIIECLQFDEKSWQDLLSLYSSRQEEIDRFLAAVRG